MEKLSKDELINLYETLPEEMKKKLDIYNEAKQLYEGKQKLELLKKERIEKAIELIKEAKELLNIYRLELTVTSRSGILIRDENGQDINKDKKKSGNKQRIKRNLKTHQSQYRIPILQVLTDLGGRGEVNEILERVYERMKNKLNLYDLENLSRGPQRWNNSARWERSKMVKEGLIEKVSYRGIWEITEKGKHYLEEHQNE